jgi:PAS domain S-box-containing protein
MRTELSQPHRPCELHELSNSGGDESRILILPPTSRDAQVLVKVLSDAGISGSICATIEELCDEVPRGVGVVIIAEEILTADPEPLVECLRPQPVWSDLPIIVLSRAGAEPPKLAATMPHLGNMTVLERPVRMTTMLSLVGSSLRARRRQYQIRDHLANLARAEQNLRDSEERVRLAVRTGKLGVWDVDLQTHELTCSVLCKANFGRAPGDSFTHVDLWASVHPDDIERAHHVVGDAIAGLREFDMEYRCVWPDGTTHWVLMRGSRPVPHGETGQRMVGVTLDITERKTAEEQRLALLGSERAARADAERASQMKDEFLATLSHELRTPLNAILGWAQLLSVGGRDAEALNEGLHTIERNARAQAQIIEDLLDMSRIISGKVRLEIQRVDMASVVETAVDTVKPTAGAKGVQIRVTLDPRRCPVSGDPNRLQQVFWNLLANAVKFTPRGGQVQVSLKRVTSHVEIRVKDSGEGISAEFLPFVFDRFRQADASTARRHGGLGLGLAIVKQLVELHGGSVRASSAGRGKGATFIVSLPVAALQDEPRAADHRRHPETAGSAPGIEQTTDDIAGIKVLVVDDEKDSCELVRRLLMDRKAIALAAATAKQALELVQSNRPEVIISDIAMPGEDGYSFIRKVRMLTHDQGGDTPAIALTAYARAEDRLSVTNAGFQQHIAKPVEPNELIAVIANLVGR